MPKKYRKRPVIIEALQWEGDFPTLLKFCPSAQITELGDLCIPTLEGDHLATLGDYIIKGIKGEFYPCKKDIFDLTYDCCEEQFLPKLLDEQVECPPEYTKLFVEHLEDLFA